MRTVRVSTTSADTVYIQSGTVVHLPLFLQASIMKTNSTSSGVRLCPTVCRTGYIPPPDLQPRCETCLGAAHAGPALTPDAFCQFCARLSSKELNRRVEAYWLVRLAGKGMAAGQTDGNPSTPWIRWRKALSTSTSLMAPFPRVTPPSPAVPPPPWEDWTSKRGSMPSHCGSPHLRNSRGHRFGGLHC